jgi:hypothetical protein
LKPKLAQHVDLVRVVVEHRQLDPVGVEQAADDLAEAAEAGDDHVVLVRLDRVGLALRSGRLQRGAITRS